VNYRFRPTSTWPGEMTPRPHRRSTPFGASYPDTLDLLERELDKLQARDVVIELALGEQDIRLDGLPRSQAQPEHPGVVVSFDSKHGPLRYATDVFRHWHANLRAIALGLEALRKVERYGITKRGEQYVGWKQLEAPSQTPEAARELLIETVRAAGLHADGLGDDRLARLARRHAHPDAEGGSNERFLAVQSAAERLGVGA
jgi:hypothetical protein